MARRNSAFGISPHMPQLVEVQLTSIHPNPFQPRKILTQESIDQLATNIKEKGLLFPPVVLKTEDPDIFTLAAGQRRLKALEKLEWETIPVMIAETGHPLEIALIENLQREDPHPMDMAESIVQLADEFSYTHQQLANIIGERRTTVTEWLSISRLPDEVRQECRALDNVTKMHLVALARLADDPEALRIALEQIKAGASTRDLKSQRGGREPPTRPADVPRALLPMLRVIETTHKVRDALAKIRPSSIIASHPDRLEELRELHKEIGGLIKKLERGEPKQAEAQPRARRRRAPTPSEPDQEAGAAESA